MENEKISLTQNLRESQSAAERSQTKLQSLMARLIQVGARIQSLDHIKDQAAQNVVSKNEVIAVLFLFFLVEMGVSEKLPYQQFNDRMCFYDLFSS